MFFLFSGRVNGEHLRRMSSLDRVFTKEDSETKHANAKGGDHFRAGRFQDAARCYSGAIEADSDPSELAKLLANRSAAYGRLGNLEAALADGKRAVELDPSYIKGYFRETKAHMALGQFRRASKSASEGLRKQPDNKELQQALQDASSEVGSPAQPLAPRAKHAVTPASHARLNLYPKSPGAAASAVRSTGAMSLSRASSVDARTAKLEARLIDAEAHVQLVEAHAHANVAEAARHGQSALARSRRCGLSLSQAPTRLLRAALWARKEGPSPAWMPERELRRRYGACSTSPATGFDHLSPG